MSSSAVASRSSARRQRSNSENSLSGGTAAQQQQYAGGWFDDEMCSVCARPVDKPGSLYCSSDCRQQDELTAGRSAMLAGLPPSVSDPALVSSLANNSTDAALRDLRYAAFPSPALSAVTTSPKRSKTHQHHHSRSSISSGGAMSPLQLTGALPVEHQYQQGKYAVGVPIAFTGRWRPSMSSTTRPQAQPQAPSATTAGRRTRTSATLSPKMVALSRRRGSNSSSRSSSPESSDPTTPSPHIWATSAPHAHAMGEPSTFMLPPSVQEEGAGAAYASTGVYVKGNKRRTSSGAGLATSASSQSTATRGATADSMPTPSTMSNLIKFTRRPGSTAQPPPVLFSSPVLQATVAGKAHERNSSAANAAAPASAPLGPVTAAVPRSRTNTPAFTAVRSPKSSITINEQGSSSSSDDTSDLDLRDADSAASSSGFSLPAATPLLAWTTVSSASATAVGALSAPTLATQGQRKISSPLARTVALPSAVLEADRVEQEQQQRSKVQAAIAVPSVSSQQQERRRESRSAAAAAVDEDAEEMDGRETVGRGRSKARGPRSSSRRRSPSPPRRPRLGSVSASTPVIASVGSVDDDEDEDIQAREQQEKEERPRGRQRQRASLIMAARRSSAIETITEQIAVGSAS